MSVYSNLDIREAIQRQQIVCYPLIEKHISHASLDVTLGYHYYKIEAIHDKNVYNPFDKNDVDRYFEGPYRALTHQELCQIKQIQPLKNIPLDHPVIFLKPRERILAHTHEFFGIKPPGACEIRSRSSWGRNGIAVCFDAGWIDPGYINRLTLEIYNLNETESIILPVGERIAQVIFHQTGKVEGNYGLGRDNGYSGKYQTGVNLEQIIKTWSPSKMLPQSYKDQRELPIKIEGLKYE